jgi:quinol monooxygenase YgiN
MTVLMTLRVKADPDKLEALAKANPKRLPEIADKGKTMGASYHRFYATDDEILVVDEWPDERTFQEFFESTPEIPKVMAEAGVTTAPEISFFHRLDLGDEIG